MKSGRQGTILRIISEQSIETQNQLMDELKKRGIDTTQATLSRDIRELRLVKQRSADGTSRYAAAEVAPLRCVPLWTASLPCRGLSARFPATTRCFSPCATTPPPKPSPAKAAACSWAESRITDHPRRKLYPAGMVFVCFFDACTFRPPSTASIYTAVIQP